MAPSAVQSSHNGSILEVKDVRKCFPVSRQLSINRRKSAGSIAAVDGVSFTIDRGETLGIVGESGCGKSTLAETILRLQEPTSGSALFYGEDIFTMSSERLRKFRRQAQIVFQDPFTSLNPRMTVFQIVSDPWRIHSGVVPRNQWAVRVGDLLRTVGMRPEHMNRYPRQFSGGQLQRIGIARALALDPDLLICDEPVSALDVSVQAQVLNLLTDIQTRLNLATIFISHDLSVVRHLCTTVAVMYLGRIVELGAVEEVFERPFHPYTKALLSAAPTFVASKERERVILEGEVPSPSHRPDGCAFRTRCWKAEALCEERDPLLDLASNSDRLVACHYPENTG